ncbi:MAG: hypothetical protein JW900_03110 [Anaerolineae bacterium]|nr:hypothetical protein [Anaerolineae bacterium]
MGQFKIRFPNLCAWCGVRPPTDNRPVKLQRSQGNRRIRVSFQAPVCETCAAYAAEVERVIKRRELIVFIVSFLVALPPSILIFWGDELLVGLIAWPVLGIVVAVIAILVMGATRLNDKIVLRFAGPPPEGYASRTADPGELSGAQTLQFFSPEFHEQFAALNPSLIKQKR